jgi:predicted alpha/beta hydrolase
VRRSAPHRPPGVSPAPRQLELVAPDDTLLAATLYPPPRPGRGTVLIHGATGVPQTFYRRFASHLAARGLRVLTYDYRGVGGSRPSSLRASDATMTDWARLDAPTAHAWIEAHHGDEPLALLGHSFGGQLLGLVDATARARGAFLVASQLASAGVCPPRTRLLWRVFFQGLVPLGLALHGYLPAWAGRGAELPAGVAREWARWCMQPGYFLPDHPDAAARFARFRAPTVMLGFTDDVYAPPPTIGLLARALANAPIERRDYRPADLGARSIGHFGYFRQPVGGQLWDDAAAWLKAVLAGRTPPRESSWITEEELAEDLGYA